MLAGNMLCGLVLYAGLVLIGSDAAGPRQIRLANYAMGQPIVKQESRSTKIYPTDNADRNEFPFTVYLVEIGDYGTYHICTGSLVARQWVLTAAHCTGSGITHAVLGACTRDDSSAQIIEIRRERKHPGYDDYSLNHDVALLRLSRRANIQSDGVGLIRPLRSAALKETFLNNMKTCLVLGWGAVLTEGYGWAPAHRQQKQEVVFVGQAEAERRGYYVASSSLPTERDFPDADCQLGNSCYGDSGGPVVCYGRGAWYQVGITSYGSEYDGCRGGLSMVADVQDSIAWIRALTGV